MTVNKDTAAKVIEYVNKTVDTWNKQGERTKLSVTMNKNGRYSFYAFASENNLLEGSNERLHDIAIACPFHDDDAPSCYINDEIHKYHCFSCDRGGNIVNFMVEYDRLVLGLSTTYYQKVNELLINDKEMQAEIGFDTIYVNDDQFSLEDGLKRFTPILRADNIPKSYPEMASLMIKKKCSINEIKYFILLMQSGEAVIDIYREIFEGSKLVTSDTEHSYDLNEMMLDI